MNRFRIVFLAPFLSLACGGDDGTGDDGTGTSPTAPGTMDDGGSETAAPDDDGGSETAAPDDDGGSDTTGAPGDDGGEPGPPEIVGVEWTNDPACAMGTGSDVTVVAEVTDPDNDVSELTFELTAIGCTTSSAGETSVLFCPNAATYNAELVVTDPDGNEDNLEFMFMPCVDGTAP
jgi:hypothetical protein